MILGWLSGGYIGLLGSRVDLNREAHQEFRCVCFWGPIVRGGLWAETDRTKSLAGGAVFGGLDVGEMAGRGLVKVVDSRLKGVFDEVKVMVVLKVGLLCSSEEPLLRPSMREVIRYLEGEVALPENLGPPCEGGEKGGFAVEFENSLPLRK